MADAIKPPDPVVVKKEPGWQSTEWYTTLAMQASALAITYLLSHGYLDADQGSGLAGPLSAAAVSITSLIVAAWKVVHYGNGAVQQKLAVIKADADTAKAEVARGAAK